MLLPSQSFQIQVVQKGRLTLQVPPQPVQLSYPVVSLWLILDLVGQNISHLGVEFVCVCVENV